MQQLIMAILLGFLVPLILGRFMIPLLKMLNLGQMVREDGPKTHYSKAGTPTMGGLIILTGILAGTLAFSMTGMEFVLPALLVSFSFGIVGFLDDFIKLRKKRSLGLRAYQKVIAQFGLSLILAWYAYNNPYIGSTIELPILGIEWDLGILYIPFIMFLVIGTVNAVNLTDGLDGLASGVTLIYAVTMALMFFVMAQSSLNQGKDYLSQNLHGMSVFAAATAGACMGFLRYNTFPARVFMGDTGSFALGGAVAVMAIFSRAALLLPIMGACFVASVISVILQVGSYKLRNKKRVFKMAPLHHHFELMGVPETKIVVMYMIVTVALCLLCLLAYV